MDTNNDISLVSHFSIVSDPRIERTKKHKLIDILTIAICAVIADADSFEEIEVFGNERIDWFESFLELPHGIPSHDTFTRVFSRMDPKELQLAFSNWVNAFQESIKGQVVAIDGKTLRRSFDKANGNAPLHMVSAWAADSELVLGQLAVDKKSNEIKAIPRLLQLLFLKGAIVSIDAIGCQKDIAQVIIEKKADYLLAVKKNQPALHEDIELAFQQAEHDPKLVHSSQETADKGHGRLETRLYQTITNLEWVPTASQWPKAHCVGRVISTREWAGKKTVETRYYISSINGAAADFAHAVREHWGIENKVHWVLDVTFGEDRSRIRKDHSAENMAVLRRIALNILKRHTSPKKMSLKMKRKKAAWDNNFLIKALLGN